LKRNFSVVAARRFLRNAIGSLEAGKAKPKPVACDDC
jgi:hypothetical protein